MGLGYVPGLDQELRKPRKRSTDPSGAPWRRYESKKDWEGRVSRLVVESMGDER